MTKIKEEFGTIGNGVDFIKYARTQPAKDLSNKVRDKIRQPLLIGGMMVGAPIGSIAMLGYSWGIEPKWFPGHDINHNGVYDGEGWYYLGYSFGIPAATCAIALGLEFLIGKIVEVNTRTSYSKEEDQRFFEVYDSLAELVRDDNFIQTEEFRNLIFPFQPVYRDALRIERLTEKLSHGEVANVQEIKGELESSESIAYVDDLVGKYLEKLPVETLPRYNTLLRENELVRMANSYVQEGKLSEVEKILDDGRFSSEKSDEVLSEVSEEYINRKKLADAERIAKDGRASDSTRTYLLNRIAQIYLDNSNFQRAEELWRTTENYEMLKGPLLRAYKASGNNKKVAELFALS